jgi:hypothetical protein
MIPRYSPKDVAALFSDEHRFDTMLEVELLAAEGSAERRGACRPRGRSSFASVVPSLTRLRGRR